MSYEQVIEEIKRRAEYYSNDYYYCFRHKYHWDNQKLEKIVFKGNQYTCMLKYESFKPFIDVRINRACDALYQKNWDPDIDPEAKGIVDYIVNIMEDDDDLYMIRMILLD